MKLQSVHNNSVEAYHGIPLTKRQAQVVQAFEVLGQATDLQVSEHLDWPINSITGRITELRDMRVLIEDHNIIRNGRQVRVCRVKAKETLF